MTKLKVISRTCILKHLQLCELEHEYKTTARNFIQISSKFPTESITMTTLWMFSSVLSCIFAYFERFLSFSLSGMPEN